MKTHPYRVNGQETITYFPERTDDLKGFHDFIARNTRTVIGLDTETTGLKIYSNTFKCRLVQFGNATEAWVLRADLFADVIKATLTRPDLHFVAHNAPFDLLVLDRTGLAPLEVLADRVYDTQILAHLCDPRTEQEGGTGLGLKPLSAIYVDADAPDTAEGLYEVFRKEYGKTKKSGEGWAAIDIDHPTYVLYAGLDVIFATRLLLELGTMVRGNGLSDLAVFEHKVMRLVTRLQKRGVKVDVAYTETLRKRLAEEEAVAKKAATRYGVVSVNSPKQVTEALQGMGEEWSTKTDSGALSVSKEALLPMADLNKDWERLDVREPNPLADAVLKAKRAKKWGSDYAQAFLDLRDEDDRIHPNIRALAARTARMSVSAPPLQQLPSGDWQIRRAIIADPGKVIVAADYSAVEMRVLAAIANVSRMKRLIAEDADLHTETARMVYGDAFDKADPKAKKRMRQLMKTVGFGKVYGGGATGLARQSGLPYADVKHAVDRYDEVYPEIKAYGNRLQRDAEYGGMEVVTPIGRHLPLDRDRTYSATNYVVQSTARDVLCHALLRISDAGLEDHLLLPVHDEVVAQADPKDADEVVREIGRLMSQDFLGVPLATEASVYGPSWGHGYGAPLEAA